MPSYAPTNRQRSILVIAPFFPSRNQSAVYNATAQSVLRGGRVTVVADRSQGKTYPASFETLGLRERTRYMPLGSPRDVLRGLRPFLLPLSHAGREAYRGLPKILFSRRWHASGVRQFAKTVVQAPLLVADSFDLVHAHHLVGAYEFLPVARILDIPLITTFHGLPVKETGPELGGEKIRTLFQWGHLFLLNTRFARGQLVALGCPEEKIRILPQGLPLEGFPYLPQPYPKDGRVVLLTVARLSREKGHRFVIEAVGKLRARWPGLQYRIVGTGPERGPIEALIRERQLEDCVSLTGEVTDEELLAEYHGAHIFILPSIPDPVGGYHTETQGVVIQEAQACGVVTVATRAGGIPECVDDGKSCFLVNPASSSEIAEKIGWLLDHPEQWEAWQRAGREWVEANFAMQEIGKRLWDVYGQVIDAYRTRSPERHPSA